uniref:Uncharacterized protein n=1 Tax=Arundo donax TaxID=35708 RepID=A0A0A9F0Q9_ARUDO
MSDTLLDTGPTFRYPRADQPILADVFVFSFLDKVAKYLACSLPLKA